MDKREQTVLFIDVTVPNDHKELWNMQKADIIPIVVGCTGIVDNAFMKYLKKIPTEINVFELQKIVLLKTCYIEDFCPRINLDAIGYRFG